jgi:hypothetical protein
MPALWELIDSLPLECLPHAIRGDCNYGNEANMVECEKRDIPYLFKLRQTAKVKIKKHFRVPDDTGESCYLFRSF